MTAPALRIDATARLVTLPCNRSWPKGPDGQSLRPVRGTWYPLTLRDKPDEEPSLVPLISCPRCARQIALVIEPSAAKRLAMRMKLGSKVPAPSQVAVDGTVTPEPRCKCGWFAPVRLGEWDRWQTLWCAIVKEGGRTLLRPIYAHAADAVDAKRIIILGRPWRTVVSIAPVIRNDRERAILLTGLGM